MNNAICKQYILNKRAMQTVYRNEIIVLDHFKHKTKAINPSTGDPWYLWFVNNNGHSTGTYEDPFHTIAQAQAASGPNDIIYIYSQNDGSSYDVTDNGFVLKNYQKVFGSGISHNLNTTIGNITVPRQTYALPKLEGTATGVGIINLVNNNEISGVTINGNNDASYAILGGESTSINSAAIQNNTITGIYKADCIKLTANGSIDISYNNINMDSTSMLDGITHRGVYLQTALGQTMNANIDSNTMTIAISGDCYGINSNNANGTFAITNNHITSTSIFEDGAVLSSDSAQGSYVISGNTLIGSRRDISYESSSAAYTINNNQMSIAGYHGFGICYGIMGQSSTGECSITDNTVTVEHVGVFSAGVGIGADSSQGSFAITGNTVSISGLLLNFSYGIKTTSSSADFSIRNNSISVTGVDGPSYGILADSVTGDYTITSNEFAITGDSDTYGISTDADAVIINLNTGTLSGAGVKHNIVSTGLITVENNNIN